MSSAKLDEAIEKLFRIANLREDGELSDLQHEIATLLRDERARADCGHPKACWQETLVCGRCERPLPCIQHTKIGGRAETKSIGHCAWCSDLARERARLNEVWKLAERWRYTVKTHEGQLQDGYGGGRDDQRTECADEVTEILDRKEST